MFGKTKSWWFGSNSLFAKGIDKSKKVFTEEKTKKASSWLGGFIEDVNPQVETTIAPSTIVMVLGGIFVLSRII